MTVRIPQFLNRPMAILIFESDEVVIGMFGFYIAMLSGSISWLFALFLFFYYRRVKKRSSRGLLRHLPHIFGFKSFKGFPHAFVTEFME